MAHDDYRVEIEVHVFDTRPHTSFDCCLYFNRLTEALRAKIILDHLYRTAGLEGRTVSVSVVANQALIIGGTNIRQDTVLVGRKRDQRIRELTQFPPTPFQEFVWQCQERYYEEKIKMDLKEINLSATYKIAELLGLSDDPNFMVKFMDAISCSIKKIKRKRKE